MRRFLNKIYKLFILYSSFKDYVGQRLAKKMAFLGDCKLFHSFND